MYSTFKTSFLKSCTLMIFFSKSNLGSDDLFPNQTLELMIYFKTKPGSWWSISKPNLGTDDLFPNHTWELMFYFQTKPGKWWSVSKPNLGTDDLLPNHTWDLIIYFQTKPGNWCSISKPNLGTQLSMISCHASPVADLNNVYITILSENLNCKIKQIIV